MRGAVVLQGRLFTVTKMDDLVPVDHPLTFDRIGRSVFQCLSRMDLHIQLTEAASHLIQLPEMPFAAR